MCGGRVFWVVFFFGRVVKEINIIVINIFVFPILGEFSQIPLGIFIAITIVSAILNIFSSIG